MHTLISQRGFMWLGPPPSVCLRKALTGYTVLKYIYQDRCFYIISCSVRKFMQCSKLGIHTCTCTSVVTCRKTPDDETWLVQ